jgi:hypothetical protein
MEKKRIIKSYEKLTQELQELMKEKYPYGYSNKLISLNNANNERFYAVPLETEDTTYLIKVQVEKIKKHSDSDDQIFFNVDDEDYDEQAKENFSDFDLPDDSYEKTYDDGGDEGEDAGDEEEDVDDDEY